MIIIDASLRKRRRLFIVGRMITRHALYGLTFKSTEGGRLGGSVYRSGGPQHRNFSGDVSF